MRKVLFLTTVLAFVFTSSVWAADISGNWTLKMTGPQGEESVPLVIKAAGENLTVTGTHTSFKEMTGTGTLKGDAITFNLKAASMEFVFTGKVTGNKMAGTREVKMGSGGGQGGQGGAPAGGQGGAPAGGQGGAPAGGQGGAPAGGQGGAPAGGQGGAPAGGQGGAPAGGQGGGQSMSSAWTAEKK
jgi:hypothetical protein